MNTTVTPPLANPPDDPVHAALADPEVLPHMLRQAHAVLLRWVSNHSTAVLQQIAEDAVQETLRRAFQNRANYDSAKGEVRGWLHGILVHVARKLVQELDRLPVQFLDDSSAMEQLDEDPAADACERAEDQIKAEGLLAKLSQEQRELLRLWYFEGLGHAAIAQHFGISCTNARVRLFRTMQELKIMAGTAPGEDQP